MNALSVLVLSLLSITFVTASSSSDYPSPLAFQKCVIGDTVENHCNKCVCTEKYIYECTSVDCRNITAKNESISRCQSNMVYHRNSTTCICNKDGYWPHIKCKEIFQSLLEKKPTNINCEANTYIKIDCNVCRCGSTGKIDADHCTKNVCKKDENKTRRSSNFYGNCEPQMWYSLAPCQFCYCINKNKLVCNTGNYNSKLLQLGNYNLTVCGKDYIRDAIELMPNSKSSLREREIFGNNSNNKLQAKYLSNSDVIIEVHSENAEKYKKETNTEVVNNEYSSDEHYEQNIKPTTEANRQGTYTQIPFQEFGEESNELNSEGKFENSEDDDSDNLESYKVEANTKPKESKELNVNMEHTLNIDLPTVLDKMLSLALRKSMVRLETDNKCEPGSIKAEKCNTCFCMKNGKLLCTNKHCD